MGHHANHPQVYHYMYDSPDVTQAQPCTLWRSTELVEYASKFLRFANLCHLLGIRYSPWTQIYAVMPLQQWHGVLATIMMPWNDLMQQQHHALCCSKVSSLRRRPYSVLVSVGFCSCFEQSVLGTITCALSKLSNAYLTALQCYCPAFPSLQTSLWTNACKPRID